MVRPWKAVLTAVLAAVLATTAAVQAQAAPRVPFMRGMTVAGWGPAGYDQAPTRKVLRKLSRTYHVDTVTLTVVWTQKDAFADTVTRGGVTVPTANLVAAIRYARSLGMKVILRPYVDPADGSWRGQVQPTDRTAWFASYDRFILKYAALAQREHVTGFVVGSEMVTLSVESQRWIALVNLVRQRFRGFLAYQANWGEEAPWWGSVDAISISAYYELSNVFNASVADLVAAWTDASRNVDHKDWFAEVQRLHDTYQRPVFFGEIGYRNVADAARFPWATSSAPNVPLSAVAQRNAYQAAFEVWYRVPWFRGFEWWYVAAAGGGVPGRDVGADHQPLLPTLRALGRWYARKP